MGVSCCYPAQAKAEKARAEAPKVASAETEEERQEKLEELRAQKKREEQARAPCCPLHCHRRCLPAHACACHTPWGVLGCMQ